MMTIKIILDQAPTSAKAMAMITFKKINKVQISPRNIREQPFHIYPFCQLTSPDC